MSERNFLGIIFYDLQGCKSRDNLNRAYGPNINYTLTTKASMSRKEILFFIALYSLYIT